MAPLNKLIYSSAVIREFTDAELANLLTYTHGQNASAGVTGILLYSEGSFFQVLDGESTIIEASFERISRDQCHSNLTLIIREPITRRSFANWSMGFSEMESGQRPAAKAAGL